MKMSLYQLYILKEKMERENLSSEEGYLKLCAVLQKYIDQGISVNTSYNPRFYADEKIPMSEMLQHLIMCYKYGTKQLYYFNTNDGQGEIDIDKLNSPLADSADDEVECDSCVI
jgi:ribonucleoside-diphosphate reductase alpha chain